MDEIDKHILETCRHLDCSFLTNDDINFGSFTTDYCFEFLIRSLWLIDPSARPQIPSWRLPPSINSRFRIASSVSELLKKHNVGGDYGYQTLLYGTLRDLRLIFVNVIEKLPRESEPAQEHISDAKTALLETASVKLERDPTWVPEFCRRLRMKHDGRFWCPGEGQPDFFSFLSSNSHLWDNEDLTDGRSWITTLLRGNEQASDINRSIITETKRAKPALPPKPIMEKPEQIKKRQDIEASKEELQKLLKDQKILRNSIVETHVLSENIQKKTVEIQEQEKDEKLFKLLQNSEQGREKLTDFLEQGNDRMEKLEREWDEVRSEKSMEVEELRRLRGFNAKEDQLKRQIEYSRTRAAELITDIERSEILAEKLERKATRIPEDFVKRDELTIRIFEMTANLNKQQQDLDKVINENSIIQKEMKWLSQTLFRTFSTIDDTLFKDTSCYKGEQAYRIFGRLNAKCNEAMQLIEKKGNNTRTIEDLQDRIELEQQKQFAVQLARIEEDLRNIQTENEQLQKL